MAKSVKENYAYDFRTPSGNTITKSFSSDAEAQKFDTDNQNISGFKRIK
jgi:hypothetical protein